jgi:ATP-dependent helicase HepA
MDHRGRDVSDSIPLDRLADVLQRGDPSALRRPEIREDLLPGLLLKAREVANRQAPALVADAERVMGGQLDREITRLRALRAVNPSVRAEEVDLLVRQKASLAKHLSNARLRLDAIRLIQRGSN